MTQLPPLDDMATDLETLQFLNKFLVYVQPKIVVEAGTWKGHFSVVAAEYLPNSRVYTADIFNHDLPKIQNLFAYIGDFEEMLERISEPINFAYLDSGPPFFEGDELESGIRWRHYQAVKPLMAKGGLIVNHDMNSRDWNYAEDILADSSLYLPGGRGITIKQM